MSSRRDEIVSIARGIFASRGFKNTSMRDIADACGLLAGSLYSHFKSKSEILQLILDPFYDQLIPAQEEAAAMSGTGAQRTEEMLRRACRVLVDNNEEMTIIHYDWQDLLGVEEFADIRDRSNYALELWHQVIMAGIGDGTLRAGVDPEVSVRVITSSLHGVLDRKRYGARPNPLVEEGLDSLIDEIVLMMLAGLASSAGRPRRRTAASTGKGAQRSDGPKSSRSGR